MGRPSKLSEKQWSEIERKHLAGETLTALAKKYKVGISTISERVSERIPKFKQVAAALAYGEVEYDKMTVSEKETVRSLTDTLKQISHHLGGAAKYGSMTAHRLSQIAHIQTDRIDETATLDENQDALKSVMAMTRGANDAASIGLNLLAANKEIAQRNEPPPEIREIRLVPLLPK